jgi:DNA-binding transcriptional regulator YdaS (Cro superfamily)
MSDDGISKVAFADVVGVSPGRVSQWISDGKIHGDALVGTGRKARIRGAVAVEQLKTKLDVDHRVRSSTKAQLDGISFASPTAPPAPAPAPRSAVSEIEQQIQAERLEGFRRDNRRKAEEEAARSGRYVRADDSSRAMGRIAAMLVGLFESWLGELASKLAAKFGLAQRDVLHLLRSEFRTFRAGASSAMRREAVQLPELVQDGPTDGHSIDQEGLPAMVDAENAAADDERQVEQ